MAYNLLVEVNFEKSYITIEGFTLKYKWNDDISMYRGGRSIKGLARIDPSDPTKIYLMLESRSVRLDAARHSGEPIYSLTLQDDFWNGLSVKLHRNTIKSKKFNDEQKWIKAMREGKIYISIPERRRNINCAK